MRGKPGGDTGYYFFVKWVGCVAMIEAKVEDVHHFRVSFIKELYYKN